MTFADLSPLANQLWQSTLCCAVAWLLTLTLRKNRAAVRYWLWLAASAKFLIPFSLLVGAGSQLGWRTAPAIEQPQFSSVIEEIGKPFVAAHSAASMCAGSNLAAPLTSVSGVTGSNLKLRIAAIVASRTADSLSFGRQLLLAAAAVAAIAGPISIGILSPLPSRGQTPAATAPRAFEAASVKPTQGGRTRSIEPGRITYLDTTLGEFITMAYGLKRYQVSGPDWIMNADRSSRYDLVATAGTPVSADEIRRMLGPLLVERFHLAFHRETRELPVFALVVAKGGPKFKQAGDGGVALPPTPDGEGGLSFKNYSLAAFADWLSFLPALGRPVIDHTNLDGRYSFSANLLDLPKDASPVDMKIAMGRSDAGDAIFSTLSEQLGLKLESQKAPIELLVIDHADKVPVEN